MSGGQAFPGAATGGGWHEANQRYLLEELDRLRGRMTALLEEGDAGAVVRRGGSAPPAGPSPAAPIDTLCLSFGLTPFERDILLLCAGAELDARFGALCRRAAGGPAPTFGLALALAGGEGDWAALTPGGALRHWHLLSVGPGEGVTGSPLRLPERVLHHLVGLRTEETELAGVIRPFTGGAGGLVPSHEGVARALARRLEEPGAPVVQLVGSDVGGGEGIAVAAAALLGMEVHRLSAAGLPREPGELHRLARLWERESALDAALLLVDVTPVLRSDPERRLPLLLFLELLRAPVVVTGPERVELRDRSSVALDVPRPTPREQAALWREALGGGIGALNGAVDRVVAHFDMDGAGIRGVAEALDLAGGPGDLPEERLWAACRAQARPALEGLAHRIEPRARWDDLVLPELQLQTLRMLAAHVRNRSTVLQEWGFQRHASRGHGVSALFAGPSGTGKTLAAEVVAGELGLDLYLIDLSQVVNKYIGETEKNLSRVFDAAERGGAVLLFDEADALFGKRSEVKDSHDRYANIEVSYLLQRMESYRGLAILTTNQKGALDDAFLRRIRFVVAFPFPGATQRAEIWRRAFPRDTPTRGLDPEKLARLNVSGGHIRNIALNAAFLAADADEPVGMEHLLAAARLEYAKLEKPFTDADPGGWR
jgi:hypothetical protein